jgi:hypothetical protein
MSIGVGKSHEVADYVFVLFDYSHQLGAETL